MKRFYKIAAVVEAGDGWTIELDGRPIKTPAKTAFVAPTRAMADAAAAEWDAQGEDVVPASMPVTKAVNTAIDRTAREFGAVAEAVAAYGGADLICYRADSPAGLVARQEAAWDPMVRWAAEDLGARLVTTSGIMHVDQPGAGQETLDRLVRSATPFELTGLYDLVAISGSLILGLAVSHGRLSVDDAWAASRVDADWQEEQWGVDDEAARTAAFKREEFGAAARLIDLARSE